MPSSRQTRKHRLRRGGVAPVDYFNAGPAELNLGQGRQFSNMTRSYHGGGLVGGPYPTALGNTLPQDLIGAAKLEPLQKAFDEIKGMQDGGRRCKASRKSRKASRKNRKNRKSRKNRTLKGRKASRKNRKNRKASRKNRKNRKSRNARKNRKDRKSRNARTLKGRKGGAHLGYQNVNAPGMLLTNAQYAKAGLSPEWALAKDPNAFAPLASRS